MMTTTDFPGGSDGKASAYNAGDPGSIPGSGRFPGEGNGNRLQYSCVKNPMNGGACWCPWGHKELDMTERLRFPIHLPFLNHCNHKSPNSVALIHSAVVNLLILNNKKLCK